MDGWLDGCGVFTIATVWNGDGCHLFSACVTSHSLSFKSPHGSLLILDIGKVSGKSHCHTMALQVKLRSGWFTRRLQLCKVHDRTRRESCCQRFSLYFQQFHQGPWPATGQHSWCYFRHFLAVIKAQVYTIKPHLLGWQKPNLRANVLPTLR